MHFVYGHRRNKIGRGNAQQTTSYQCSQPIFYSLPSRGPVQDVAHIDVVIFRYATNKTGCRAQSRQLSRVASVETATIVKPGSDETVDKSSHQKFWKIEVKFCQLSKQIFSNKFKIYFFSSLP